MVQMHQNIVGLDAAIFMHPKPEKFQDMSMLFNDPLVDNKDSKKIIGRPVNRKFFLINWMKKLIKKLEKVQSDLEINLMKIISRNKS